MALATLGTALATAGATAGVNFGLSKLFGGKSGSSSVPLQSFAPTGINAGGLSTSMANGNLSVAPSAERAALVGNAARLFREQADAVGGLRASVAPGVSALRASRLGEVDAARSVAIGNLRDNLARRRIQGSSFGQDALIRAEAEFAGERDRVAAESFMAELEATQQFINQEFALRRSEFQTGLDELNLHADIATKLSAKATDALAQNARTLSVLNAQEAAAAGKFFGQTFQPVADAFGKGAGSLFKSAFSGGGGGPISTLGAGASNPGSFAFGV